MLRADVDGIGYVPVTHVLRLPFFKHVCAALLAGTVIGCSGDKNPQVTFKQAGEIVGEPLPFSVAVDKTCGAVIAASNDNRAGATPGWRAFRTAHPYHQQGVVVGAPAANGTREIIIAEPPPGTCPEDIRAISPLLRRSRIVDWDVGFDGRVSDVVATLPRLTQDEVDLLVLNIHRQLFGDTYKARLIASRGTPAEARPQLDLTVSGAELREWFASGHETFEGAGGGPAASIATLLAQGRYGEYFSTVPGFVAWILPRRSDIAPHLGAARHWAVDADLVLGALADDRSLAVIGRERQVSVDVLPPLRTETIATLASAGTDHLAQSYERRFVLSGRYNEQYDWAPIYLSPILTDDEYGSLLNITDQLLKSWSEFGTVKYVRFPYEARGYPFDKPLHDVLNSSQVTFNWNTKGAGYVSDKDGMKVYALNRTGALPVSYFAGTDDKRNPATEAAENRAYEFFAGTNDPNLVRVVQYAALYQMFRAFDVWGSRKPLTVPRAYDVLESDVTLQLLKLSEFPSSRISEDAGLPAATREAWTAAVAKLNDLALKGDTATMRNLAHRLTRDKGDTTTQRADMALYRRAYTDEGEVRADASAQDKYEASLITLAREVSPVLSVFLGAQRINMARQKFVAGSRHESRGWIRTASIVQSWSTNRRFVGGHNLDAAVTRVRASSELSRGEIRVIREGEHSVVLANEADIPRLEANVREISSVTERGGDGTELSAMLSRLRERPIRPRMTAFPPPSRIGNTRSTVADRLVVGYERVRAPFPSAQEAAATLLESRQRPWISVKKLPDGSMEISTRTPPRVIRAPNTASVIDLIAHESRITPPPGTPRQLQLLGFSERDGNALRRNVQREVRRTTPSAKEETISILRKSESDNLAVADMMTKKMDFSRAKISDARVVDVVEEGVHVKAMQVDLEIPSLVTGERSFFARILIFMEGLSEGVQAAITRAMARLGLGSTPDIAVATIRLELERTFGPAVRVKFDVNDITIVIRVESERAVGEN